MKIRRRVLESLAQHARENLPNECCGILLAEEGDVSTLSLALRAENGEGACPEHRYVLGHKAHLKAVEMEASGAARIIGYYHSHPQGSTKPSHRDTGQAVADVTYLIIGVRDGVITHAAWRLEGDSFVPQPLEVAE